MHVAIGFGVQCGLVGRFLLFVRNEYMNALSGNAVLFENLERLIAECFGTLIGRYCNDPIGGFRGFARVASSTHYCGRLFSGCDFGSVV